MVELSVTIKFKYDCEIDHVIVYLEEAKAFEKSGHGYEDPQLIENYVKFFRRIQLEIWFVKFLKGMFR